MATDIKGKISFISDYVKHMYITKQKSVTRISPYFIALQYLATLEVIKVPVFNANSIVADQMPHSSVSDLRYTSCLSVSLLGEARYKKANVNSGIIFLTSS